MEAAYPPTHAKYKSLILGMRGPNISGPPVYEHAFLRALNVEPVRLEIDSPLLEAIHFGQKHPVWVAAQRSYFGGLSVLGSIIGKKMFLDDFLQIVLKHRSEWFSDVREIKTCCDPPPAKGAESVRFSNIAILKEFGFAPKWMPNSTAPDVRESIIQSIGAMMKRRHGAHPAFRINAEPSRFLMASTESIKRTSIFTDSIEGSYVWDDDGSKDKLVSVSNKKTRQPKYDDLIEGSMRCIENIVSNYCALQITDEEKSRRLAEQRKQAVPRLAHPQAWMG